MRKANVILIGLILLHCSSAVKFRRTILSVGFSYYKILMSLGTCKETLLFNENKVWARVNMNRIFDIYYKSKSDEYKVSRVEINIVVNNSDILADSGSGVGQSDFCASVYLPANTVVIFYSLKMYTCSHPIFDDSVTNVENAVPPAGFFDGSDN